MNRFRRGSVAVSGNSPDFSFSLSDSLDSPVVTDHGAYDKPDCHTGDTA
jgi:hypothetical protein